MYNNEILFMRKFLASLIRINVSELPYNNMYFQLGISQLHCHFNEHKNEFKEYVDDISLLFMKRPIEGNYDEFCEVLSDINGSLISFNIKNPCYERVKINFEEEVVRIYLNDPQFNVSEECMMQCAEAFCKGAQII